MQANEATDRVRPSLCSYAATSQLPFQALQLQERRTRTQVCDDGGAETRDETEGDFVPPTRQSGLPRRTSTLGRVMVVYKRVLAADHACPVSGILVGGVFG